MSETRKMSLTTKVLAGMALGIAIGLAINLLGLNAPGSFIAEVEAEMADVIKATHDSDQPARNRISEPTV